MSASTANLFTGSLLAISLLAFSMPVEAGVRDHRSGKESTNASNTAPPPAVNRPGQSIADKTTGNGGVTVTSRPRPKNEKVCLIVLPGSIGCTSNQRALDAAKWAKGQK